MLLVHVLCASLLEVDLIHATNFVNEGSVLCVVCGEVNVFLKRRIRIRKHSDCYYSQIQICCVRAFNDFLVQFKRSLTFVHAFMKQLKTNRTVA